MKKRSFRALGVATISLALAVGIMAPASATISHPAGGTWDHGVNSTQVWSNYYNATKTWHKSSVESQNEGYTTSPWMSRYAWSYASQPDDFWHIDYAYYNYIA